MNGIVADHLERIERSGNGNDQVETDALNALSTAQHSVSIAGFMDYLNFNHVRCGVVVIDSLFEMESLRNVGKHQVCSTLEEGIDIARTSRRSNVYVYGVFIVRDRLRIDLDGFPSGLTITGYKATGSVALATHLPTSGVPMATIILMNRIDIIGRGKITVEDMIFINKEQAVVFKFADNSISTVRNSVIFRSSSFNHTVVLGKVTNGRFLIKVTNPLTITRYVKAAAATGLLGAVGYAM